MRKTKSKKSTNVVPFPSGRARASDPTNVTVGQIVAVPLARNQKFLAFITTGMSEQQTADDAEDYLIDHLNYEWSRLSRLGIADDVKDQQCRDFALAAWRVFFADRAAEGAA